MLGNVISSGVKVLVLAVIVGIGSTLFSQFTTGLAGTQPTIETRMAIVLAALSLLGLGIFGPGIANGLVSGGPQLGAGAAVGAAAAGGGVVAAGVSRRRYGGKRTCRGWWHGRRGRAWRRRARRRRHDSLSRRRYIGAATTGLAKGTEAVMSPLRRAADSPRSSFEAGGQTATGEGSPAGAAAATSSAGSSARSAARLGAPHEARADHKPWRPRPPAHAVRSGDHGGGGASVDLSEGE